MLQSLKLSSRQVALISTFIAIGAVVRIAVDQVGDMVPTPAFSVVIKIGLSETLSFVSGFVYGPTVGFVTGFLIILLSDITSPYGAGVWTPFIGSIIGLLGVCAALIRRLRSRPSPMMMIISAVGLTLLSETLQNVWGALFYNTPIFGWMGSMWLGLPSLVTAIANNVILFPTVGTRAIEFLRQHELGNSRQVPKGDN
jgi:uncharacterized membrane protein